MTHSRLSLDEIERLAHECLRANGCDDANAGAVARTITAAERDGSPSHGLFRLPGYVAALKPELASLQPVYPDTVFDDRLVFESGNRRIVVEWLGRGNTDGDIVVWLPDDEMLITGDLLVAPVPFAFDSPMTDWIDTLQRLSEKGATTIVPGHGPVQLDSNFLENVLALLRRTVEAVRSAHDDGTAFADLAEAAHRPMVHLFDREEAPQTDPELDDPRPAALTIDLWDESAPDSGARVASPPPISARRPASRPAMRTGSYWRPGPRSWPRSTAGRATSSAG